LLAALLIIAIGTFFAYVALMPTLIAALILLGFALTFGLGVYVGNRTEPSNPAQLGKSFRL
jgi:Sec-independent protein secretion pathway component TatC